MSYENASGEQIAETKAKPYITSDRQANVDRKDTGSPPATFADSCPVNDPWETAIQSLTNTIRIRHYSDKTLNSYTTWVYKLRSYSQKQDPQTLTTSDVKSFLTFLAVQKRMSASSQKTRPSTPSCSFSGMYWAKNSVKSRASSGPSKNRISLWSSLVRRSTRSSSS